MDLFEALRLVEERRDDAVAITTMMGSRAWRQVSRRESLDLAVGGTMGKASSVALGICLARPDKRGKGVIGGLGHMPGAARQEGDHG
jgi:thiamine pyrophosphate-dependent acetolactate synthase large subunit-like protein